MTHDFLIKSLPMRWNSYQSHIFLKWTLWNCDAINQMLFQSPLKLKNVYFFILSVSIISDINLPPSAIFLFLTYAVCCEDIKSGRTFFSSSERAFDIIFRSTFNKEMGLQFWMNFSSLFFSVNLMIPCPWEVLRCSFSLGVGGMYRVCSSRKTASKFCSQPST